MAKMGAFIKFLSLFLVFLTFLASLYELVEKNGPNNCAMTYMFELPEYIPMDLGLTIRNAFPKYRLFAYGEGSLSSLYRDPNIPVRGIPVLFIPGNGGRHKQVRSMASIALRMTQHRGLTTMFDFYAADFNEELFAFYGGDLEKQTLFLKECVIQIMSFYKNPKFKPKNIILVGHSMGGVLARALLTLEGFDKKLVNLIITQATPHQHPIVATDYMPEFFGDVNDYWRREKDTSLKHVTVISLGGGDRDLQTESVSKSWVSTDHQCAVWCKQIVIALVRSLCDITVPDSNQLVADPDLVRKTFGFHLTNHTGYSKYEDTTSMKIKPRNLFEYDELSTDHLFLNEYTSTLDKYYSFRLDKKRQNHMIIETNYNNKYWIVGCVQKKHEDSCVEGTDLTSLLRLAPTQSYRVYAHLDSAVLHKFTHIVLHVPKTSSKTFLSARVFHQKSFQTVYHAPTALDLILDFPRSLYHHSDPVVNFENGTTSYHVVKLPTLQSAYQAYTAYVDVTSCQQKQVLPSFMRLHLPWVEGTDTYSVINPSAGGGNISLRLQVPQIHSGKDNSVPELHLYLQPTCEYNLRVVIDFLKVISQFARHYYIYLPSFVVANLLMVLCHQLFIVSKGQPCPSIAAGQDSYGQPWKLAAATTVIQYIISMDQVAEKLSMFGMPDADGSLLAHRGLMFLGLDVVLYTLAFVIVRVCAVVTHIVLYILGSIMRFMFHRIFTHHTIPYIGSLVWWFALVLGIYGSWHYSGSVGLLVTFALIIADIMASMVTFDNSDRRHTMWYLQHSLLLLTLTMFMLALPEFASWIKNLDFTRTLDRDPSRYPSIVIATTLMLIRFNTDYENWYLSYMNSFSPVVLGICAIVYGTLNVWRLNVIIPTAFVWVASVQSLGILLHRQKKSHSIVAEKSKSVSKELKKDGRNKLNCKTGNGQNE